MESTLEIYFSNSTHDLITYNKQRIDHLTEFRLRADADYSPVRTDYSCIGTFPKLHKITENTTDKTQYPLKLRTNVGAGTLILSYKDTLLGPIKALFVHMYIHPITGENKRLVRVTVHKDPHKQLKEALIDFGVELIIEEPQ